MTKLQFIQWLRKIELTKELVTDEVRNKYLSLYIAKIIADKVWIINMKKITPPKEGREIDGQNNLCLQS
jgi:hypothetical protein